jgi:hypothetical protein
MAKKVIQILKQKSSIEYQQLCRELGIGFDKYQKPRRTFYFVVNPLKKVQLIQERRVVDEADPRKYKTHYFLTPERFRGYMDRTIEEFYKATKGL